MSDPKVKSGDRINRLPIVNQSSSFLQESTRAMAHEQRVLEQNGTRRFAKVNENEFVEDSPPYTEEVNNEIVETHPLFANRQDLDGMAHKLSALASVNPDAKREVENALREKQLLKQKQLQKELGLDNTPTNSATPRPWPH